MIKGLAVSRTMPRRALVGMLILLTWTLSAEAAQAGRDVDIRIAEPGVIQRLTLTDGSQVYGRVESIDADGLVFRSIVGVTLAVPRTGIADLRSVEGRVVAGEFVPADSHNTRLMFAPTARALKRGEGYFGVYYVLPFVQVGVTDRLSIGGGTPLVFGGGSGRPVWFTPKLQVLGRPNVQAAVGVIHISGIEDVNAGIAYGVTTLGHDDAAATLGLGYAYSGEGDYSAIVMVGGDRRQSARIKWITENWFWRGGGFVSGGVRFIGQRLSADVSLVVPLIDETFAVPVVSFAWGF